MDSVAKDNALQVRDALPEELDVTSAVMVSAYSEYAASLRREGWEAYARNIADVRGRLGEADLIVAVRNADIVGAVTLYPVGSQSTGEGWPAGYSSIRLLAVQPEARGGGVAQALMAECFRRSRVQGARCVGLHTTELMAIARGMYERMGFRRVRQFDVEPIPGRLVMAYELCL